VLPFGKETTANLYSHLEYNAKVASAETISRVLGAKMEDTPVESKQSAKTETESVKPALKKSNSRKKTHLRNRHSPQLYNYII
jgi:hypothetical protein